MYKLENYEPKEVFHFFEDIAAIPHGSRNTKAISDYLVDFAKQRNLEYYQDEMNNVVIIKEASAGYEGHEPIIIQGHMDMVCEKENDCDIDFEKDGLDLYVDGDFLKARGTTLGGDDGIAVAYALAILDSDEIAHPRLEVVITVDEEIGMLGADAIDLSMLKGHMMLNIDSDVEGHFLTSCAGGMTVDTTIPMTFESVEGTLYKIVVTGLEGGHSGSEIDKGHANANMVMARIIKSLFNEMPLSVSEFAGGLKDNAIPRECKAVVVVDDKYLGEFKSKVDSLSKTICGEYSVIEKNMQISAKKVGAEVVTKITVSALTRSSLVKFLMYLRNVPDGVQNMSAVMPELVETSLNNGIISLDESGLHITASVRSSVLSKKQEILDKLTFLAELSDGEVKVSGDYPAWEYVTDSKLRDVISGVYKYLFEKEPIYEAIHAGLECGILSDKIKNLDCVSFGPNNYDIHTPKERLSISSTQRVWKLLVEFLKRC